MDTVARLTLIVGMGSLIAGILISLFSRSPGGTQVRSFFFCLAFLFVGVYRVADSVTLRQKGLGTTFGKHASIITMREHPVEAALSFWLDVLVGGAMSVCGLAGAVVFALPTPNQDTDDAQEAQDTNNDDAAEDVAEDTDDDAAEEAAP